MKIWNFGIVGAGLIADFHARAVNDNPPAKLIGFCDGGSGRAKKLAAKYSSRALENYEQMLNSGEVDVVTIATPSGFHMEPTIAAAGAATGRWRCSTASIPFRACWSRRCWIQYPDTCN